MRHYVFRINRYDNRLIFLEHAFKFNEHYKIMCTQAYGLDGKYWFDDRVCRPLLF